MPRPLPLSANQRSRSQTANGDTEGAGAVLPWQRGGRAWGGKSEKRSPMAEPCPCPPSASHCSQLPPPSLEGLIPPSHFVLRPRSLGAELEAERGRVHELEAELKALKGRSQHLEAKLEEERRRSQQLEAELEAEKGRSQCLETKLKSERGRSQVLGVELDALRGRGQRLEAELDVEKGRSQILEMELEILRGRGLGPEGAEPSPEQVLLGRWRQKVFQLLLQVRLQRGQELRLQGQVRSLGAAVAAGSRQVSLLELRLRQGEQERQALSQERLRAEAAEEELGKLGQALSRLLGTLGVALANVTVAIGALGTLSERLGRAQHRLQGHQGWGQDSATPRHSVPGPIGDTAPGPRCRHPWGHWGPRSASALVGTPVTSSGTQWCLSCKRWWQQPQGNGHSPRVSGNSHRGTVPGEWPQGNGHSLKISGNGHRRMATAEGSAEAAAGEWPHPKGQQEWLQGNGCRGMTTAQGSTRTVTGERPQPRLSRTRRSPLGRCHRALPVVPAVPGLSGAWAVWPLQHRSSWPCGSTSVQLGSSGLVSSGMSSLVTAVVPGMGLM
ncbi:uncharacterized protein GJ701_016141 isoform 2-T2 [Geothlypis trichas]